MSWAEQSDIKIVLGKVRRWTPTRKFWLTVAIEQGVITFAAACKLHDIPADELNSWITLRRLHGSEGLKLKNIQKFREAS